MKSEHLISHEDDDLRVKNIETILKYVNSKGEARLDRWKLFTEDGSGGYTGPGKYDTYDKTEEGPVGLDALKASDAWNYRWFPDWQFENPVLMQTQDPNYYVVVSGGSGYMDFPAYGGRKPYNNYYFHVFRMEDGKIKRYREHMNFCESFHVLGIDLPVIEFPTGQVGSEGN